MAGTEARGNIFFIHLHPFSLSVSRAEQQKMGFVKSSFSPSLARASLPTLLNLLKLYLLCEILLIDSIEFNPCLTASLLTVTIDNSAQRNNGYLF